MDTKILELAVKLVHSFGYSLIEDPERLGQLLEDKCSSRRHDIFLITFALKEIIKGSSSPTPKILLENRRQIEQRFRDRLGFTAQTTADVFDAVVKIVAAADSTESENAIESYVEARKGFLDTVIKDIASRPRTAPARKTAIRNGLLLLGIVMIFLGFYAKATETKYWAEGEHVVFFASHLSGGASEQSHIQLKSAQMAADMINRTGGIKGKYLRLIALDIPTDKDGARAVFQNAIDRRHATAVVAACSEDAAAVIAQISEENEIPAVFAGTMGHSEDRASSRPYLYSFSLQIDSEYLYRSLAYFTAKGLKKRAPLLIYRSDEEEGMAAIIDQLANYSISPVDVIRYTERIGLDDGQLSSIDMERPDCVIIADMGHSKDTVIEQMISAGFKGTFAASSMSASWHGVSKKTPDRIWWITAISVEDPQLLGIQTEYRDRYNEPIQPDVLWGAVMSYDSIRWTADAISRAPGYQGEALRHAFLSTRNLALSHATVSIDPRTHYPYNKAVAIQFSSDGRIKHQRRFRPNL